MEAAGIERIVQCREVFVASEPSLVDVRHHYVEACFGELHIGVNVHEWIVAELEVALLVESGCRRLISRGVIACVVVAIYAQLSRRVAMRTVA